MIFLFYNDNSIMVFLSTFMFHSDVPLTEMLAVLLGTVCSVLSCDGVTWGAGDVHSFEVPTLDDRQGHPTRGGKVAERVHDLPQVYALLETHIRENTLTF